MARDKEVDGPASLTAQDIASLIKPTASFDFDVQVDRRVKIAYEESHFYQLIKKRTNNKSGLFKSKSVSSVTERSEAAKWIDIEFYSEDGDHQFVDQMQMAMDIRKEYADAALMKVARGYLGNQQVNLMEAGPSAAEGASKIIKKCKHQYCQAAGMVLDLGSALFGGKTSEANMTKIVKAKEKTKITDIKMVSQSGTQVFEAKGE